MNIKSIRNEIDHKAALASIEELWNAKPGTPEYEEADVLITLVDAYEDTQFPTGALDPIETILVGMDDLGLTRKDLEPCIGTRARVSEILSRKRSLTLPMIRGLSMVLRVPADFLIAEYPVESVSRHDPGDNAVVAG
ncbi:MAG: transcriptional regulator [Pseudomonadota bacterium]